MGIVSLVHNSNLASFDNLKPTAMTLFNFVDSLFKILSSPYFICVLLIAAIAALVYYFVSTRNREIARWHHTFDEVRFSPQDFYEALEAAFEGRGIRDLEVRRMAHDQILLFGPQREYLRVYRFRYAFEICAAHVGTGCYVSWWFLQKNSLPIRIMMLVPVLRWYVALRTYHQIDEEDAFRDLVHECVLKTVDDMTGTKGSTLSHAERAIIGLRNVSVS